MKACKHERVADFVEVHLAVCQECGDNEYDIVKAKAVKLKAALTAANARVEALEGLAYSVLDAVAVADEKSIEYYGRRYAIPGSIRDALEALAAARGE